MPKDIGYGRRKKKPVKGKKKSTRPVTDSAGVKRKRKRF